ncbi:mechanosensitive ion channel family protein [Pseudogulbenkiania subflava]|uniref:Small-conductance mechanosensitive channel n=1 Tax=Pseudogulbenkiania subflava DSM 22618 TaxID=1123014 RepID=A0A1Y6C8D0_9NEIS|nr:mechanosensitive ion channel family protein [Pseudogulbenkiania subflava]SMF51410.1 Small-conductance mechanosensitive channel [Pseudogulbenkiania subflava DSM 22618]
MLNELFNSTNQIADVLWIIQQILGRAASELQLIAQQIDHDITAAGWDRFAGITVLVVGVAMLAEYLAGRRFRALANAIGREEASGLGSRIGYQLLRTLFRLLCVGIFMITAQGMLLLTSNTSDVRPKLLFSLLLATVTFRAVGVLSQAVFAPTAKGIRPLPIACEQAIGFHRGVMTFTLLYIVGFQGTDFLAWLGMDGELVRLLKVLTGLALNLFALGFVWLQRGTIEQLFQSRDRNGAEHGLATILSQSWPLLVTLWLLALWLLWSHSLIVGNLQYAAKMSWPWWLTLLFPIIDRLFAAALYKLCQLPWLQSHTFAQRSRRFRRIMQGGLRLIMLTIAVLTVADVLGYDAMTMSGDSRISRLLKSLLDSTVIVLLAYMVWEVLLSQIERQLPPPELETQSTLADEGEGAAAGSRRETLLPPLRTLLFFLLLIILTLSLLHALGVEIGPLLAGAGVLGIAIGLGAQKLVQDVISGIFFLLDDAFRRGEYIEAGDLRGTVERLSIRSMQLRHHLGALQTIPYSSIRTVRNMSRDWATMKLEIRLPYDVDLETVRKVIKGVGEEMLADPELGPHFILPLKSQGVMRIEESALIVRMKFTTRPGEQWVIRREAYRRVKEALEARGIVFAHRAIHVILPGQQAPVPVRPILPTQPAPQVVGYDDTHELTEEDSQRLAAMAGASAGAILAAELERQNRIDDEDSP